MYKKVAASTKSGKGSGGEAGANAGADGGGKREEAVPWSFEALPFDAAQRFVQTMTSDKIYVAFRRADGDLTKFMCLDMEPCLAVPLFQRNLFKEFLCLYLLDPWGQHYNKPGICLRRQLIYFRTTNTESFCRSTTGRAGELTAEEAGEAMLCAWALAGVGGTKKRGRTKATAARRASLLSDASQDAPAAYSGDRSSAASSTTAGGRSGGDGKSMGGKNAASYIENRPGAASAAQVFGKATDLRASPKSSSSTIIARMGTESLESVVYRLASAADVKEKKRKSAKEALAALKPMDKVQEFKDRGYTQQQIRCTLRQFDADDALAAVFGHTHRRHISCASIATRTELLDRALRPATARWRRPTSSPHLPITSSTSSRFSCGRLGVRPRARQRHVEGIVRASSRAQRLHPWAAGSGALELSPSALASSSAPAYPSTAHFS